MTERRREGARERKRETVCVCVHLVNQQILRLEIAVQHPVVVTKGHSVQELMHQRLWRGDPQARGKCCIGISELLLNTSAEIHSSKHTHTHTHTRAYTPTHTHTFTPTHTRTGTRTHLDHTRHTVTVARVQVLLQVLHTHRVRHITNRQAG